jgi:diguanylate cyclase (GGDEF)-like protein/PAS domain S-box-containing protein
MQLLSAGRAFATGESLWSKGQKDAVYFLGRYHESCDEEDFRRYESAIAVPLADNEARKALLRPHPDISAAREAMLRGGNHPDDIDGMVQLLLRFQNVGFMRRAIDVWIEGDVLVDDLVSTATELHRVTTYDCANRRAREPLLARIDQVNARLTPLEVRFADTLGEANREVRELLPAAMAAAALLLAIVGALPVAGVLRRAARAERGLQESEHRYQLAIAGSNQGLWDLTIANGRLFVSQHFRQLLGYGADEPFATTGTEFEAHVHPGDRHATRDALRRHAFSGERFQIELRLRTREGEFRWFRAAGQALHDGDGRPARMTGSIQDITDRKELEARLYAEKERAQVTLRSIGDGVVTADAEGCIDYMNPEAEQMTGWTLAEAQGRRMAEVLRIVEETSGTELAWPTRDDFDRGGDLGFAVAMLVRRDGTQLAVDESIAPIRGPQGQVVGMVAAFRDVSEDRRRAAVLSYEASHDALTGLVNRREFERRLALALKSAAEEGSRHAVVYLDLDQFKVVNDTCGHPAGDALLRQLAEVMKQRLGEGDTLARVGGDEFCAILENCPGDAAAIVAESVRQAVAEFVFAAGERSFRIGISLGLVEVQGSESGTAEVLSAADAACRLAKEKGRNRLQVYSPQDDEIASRRGEMTWFSRIQEALAANRFLLHSQEIASLAEPQQRGRHVELLVRMLDEQHRSVPPMAFIPAAERYGLMPAVDRWVIESAFATYKRRRERGELAELQTCAINVSGASIADESFTRFLHEQFERHAMPHGVVCFEITETAAVSNLTRAADVVSEFRALGCRFSLDDFGTGMSSFAYLKHLPVDYLKIDGSFVKNIARNPVDRAVVKAINEVAQAVGMRTIAEYAENDEVIAVLRDLGVHYAQGYGVARPQPFDTEPAQRLDQAVPTPAQPRAHAFAMRA